MGFKLKNSRNGISTLDMKDGEVGEIISWGDQIYVGRIVQRFNNNLIEIGRSSSKSWTQWFVNKNPKDLEGYRVRLLEDGEELIYRKE